MSSDRPKPTGKPPAKISLNGTVFPWDGIQPTLLEMPGSNLLYIPCFQNIENLKYILSHYQIDYASIKRIEDEREFLSSITDPRVRVIFNPRIADNGKLRFMQVL